MDEMENLFISYAYMPKYFDDNGIMKIGNMEIEIENDKITMDTLNSIEERIMKSLNYKWVAIISWQYLDNDEKSIEQWMRIKHKK